MKRILLFWFTTLFVTTILHAQTSSEVEKFIKKYEEQGNYVEMSKSYLEGISAGYKREVSLGLITRGERVAISPGSILLSFKSLTVPTRYWDELQKAIERDKYERQNYSRKGEMIMAQYNKQQENTTDCLLINKSSTEVSIIFMIGEKITGSDFIGYLQLLQNNSLFYK